MKLIIGTSASHVVMIQLFQSFCVPFTFCGLESAHLYNSNLYCLQYITDMCLFKILKTRNKTTVDNFLYYLNMLPVSYALDLTTLKFLCKLAQIQLLLCYMTLTVQDSMRHCVLNIYTEAVSLITVFVSERTTLRSLYAIGRPSVCLSVCLSDSLLSVCCLLSVTLVHPTQAVELFCNFFTIR